MSYCIEIKTGINSWAPKYIVHWKIPTEDKDHSRMAELISEGQDASTIRVSVDATGESMNPLDSSLGNPTPS